MRLINFLNGLLLIAVILISSCGVEEEPPPSIITLSPAEGSFDMFVTITGDNFSMNENENQVRFNGVLANIETIKKDTLIVKVPRGTSSGPVTVTINGLASLGPNFRHYDIYITGNEQNGSTTIAKLWKNGTEVSLDNPGQSFASAITVANSDSYVTGYQITAEDDTLFGYWKNSVFAPFADSDSIARVSESVVSNGFVYTAGSYKDVKAIRYWKNGVKQPIPEHEGYEGGHAFAIQVSGSDVYLGGNVIQDGISYTASWKNGIQVDFGGALTIRDIVVVGTDVHIVSSASNPSGSPFPMFYHKNGISEIIINDNREIEASALAVVDSANVYIIGSEMFPASPVMGARLWTNATGKYIFDDESESRGTGVAFVDEHLFTVGYVLTDGVYQAYYTYDNDSPIYLTNGSKNVFVTGMFVR